MNETTTMTTNPTVRDMHTRRPFVKAGDVEAFVTIRNPWQDGHKHTFDVWDKHGEALCIGCGAIAWSAWWVAEDVYGTGTVLWVDEQVRNQERKVLDSAQRLVEERLGGTVVPTVLSPKVLAEVTKIMAMHDGLEPAKQVRRGVPVPKMVRDLLVHPEHV